MQCHANFIRDRYHSIKKAILYAKEFHTSKRFCIFHLSISFHCRSKQKFHSLRTQFAAELKQLFITVAAAFRFCEHTRIILVKEKY